MSERPRWLTGTARSGTAERERERERERETTGTRGSVPRSRARRQRSAAGDASRARFERRATAVRRRPQAVLGIGAGVVVLLGVLLWLVGFSSVLATRTVTVTGLADSYEQQAVVTAAAVPVGTPLARVDTAGATERVQRIPTIASVTVSRSWPSTVVVSVQRKVPVLAVKNPQGQLQVVDDSGQPFETVSQLPPGVAQVNATADAPDPEGLKAALSVLALLPAPERATVSGVTVSSADLVIFSMGKVSVVWGGVDDGPKKLTVLQALLATNPAVIDVSAPDTPITR